VIKVLCRIFEIITNVFMKEKKDIEIDEVRRRLDRAYAVQNIITDVVLGVVIAAILLGIGFTCGYYHPR